MMRFEIQMMKSSEQADSFNNKATRLVASVYGILVGLAGIEHGIFEMLQGDVPIDSIMINAIGDLYKFWEGASERALTVLPSFLLSGVLAIVLGTIVTIWASLFVQRKYGATILLLLTMTLFLVGGGMAPIILSIFAVVSATRIDKPLTWWKANLSTGLRSLLAKLWSWILILFVIVFWSTVGVQIFGLPVEVSLITGIVGILSIAMVSGCHCRACL
jgi:hypothetical protein